MDTGDKRWYSRVTATYLNMVEFSGYAVLILYVGFYKGMQALMGWSNNARREGNEFLTEDRLGRVDRTDYQWNLFLQLQVQYWMMGLVFLGLSYSVRKYFPERPQARAIFYAVFGITSICYLCELQVLFPIMIVFLNFNLSRAVGGKRVAPWAIWGFNLSLLYLTKNINRFAMIHPTLEWMDSYRGVLAWNEVGYLIFLNCISFAMDYHWMVTKRESPIDWKKKSGAEKSKLSWLWRQEHSLHSDEYSIFNFLAFAFYLPTWLGPIGGFNAFASQLKIKQQTNSLREIMFYGLRLLAAVILKELLDRFVFANAINFELFSTMEFERWSMLDYAIIPYFVLHGIWLKFLIMWRGWRLLALLDGMEYPENMTRCMSNNYSIEGFWRSWHRSFNQWLLRYIYFPCGGSRGSVWVRIASIFSVFTAVIYFHAPYILSEPHYLIWGYAMAIFIIPEIATKYFIDRVDKNLPDRWYYRYFAGLGGAFNIFILILANMLGYGIDVADGALTRTDIVQLVLRRLFFPFDWWFFLVVGSVLFSAVQFMLLYREYEREREDEKMS